jgi:two-component system phosphate regulon response regulator PhoB
MKRTMADKILVIEDEENIQKLARMNLVASGYRVFVAGNGGDGIKLAQHERPDLILLDLRLPDMSGWDVLMTLKTDRKLEKSPVIIVTATVPQELEYRFPSLRTAGYLVKPFHVDELLEKVQQVLEARI